MGFRFGEAQNRGRVGNYLLVAVLNAQGALIRDAPAAALVLVIPQLTQKLGEYIRFKEGAFNDVY